MLFSLSDGDGVNRAGVRTKAHVRACNVAPDVRIRQNSGSDSCPPAAGDANVSRSSSPAGSDIVPLFTSFVLQRAKVVINVSKCKVGVSLSVLKVGGSLLFFSHGLPAGPVSRLEISVSRPVPPVPAAVFPVALSGDGAGSLLCGEAQKRRAPNGTRLLKGGPCGWNVTSPPLSCLDGCRCPAGWDARSGGP